MARQRRQQRRVNDIIQVDLGDGECAYGHVLESPLIAFYDFSSRCGEAIEKIVEQPVAFKILVHNDAVKSGKWPVIGNAAPRMGVADWPWFFLQDPITREIFVTRDGSERIPASAEQIRDLECGAVWDGNHVVDRIRDHLAGRKNIWVESLRPKLTTH